MGEASTLERLRQDARSLRPIGFHNDDPGDLSITVPQHGDQAVLPRERGLGSERARPTEERASQHRCYDEDRSVHTYMTLSKPRALHRAAVRLVLRSFAGR